MDLQNLQTKRENLIKIGELVEKKNYLTLDKKEEGKCQRRESKKKTDELNLYMTKTLQRK